MVKGSNFLEGLNNLGTIIWDKTGTLTEGVFDLSSIVSKNGYSEKEVLEFAAYAENHSSHPIAQFIIQAYSGKIDDSRIENYQEVAGHGIKAIVKGRNVLVGNKKIIDASNIPCPSFDEKGTIVHVAIDSLYAGYIVLSDELKPDSAQAIQSLKRSGISF